MIVLNDVLERRGFGVPGVQGAVEPALSKMGEHFRSLNFPAEIQRLGRLVKGGVMSCTHCLAQVKVKTFIRCQKSTKILSGLLG